MKLTAAVFAPTWPGAGARLGLVYEHTRRASTAEQYAFTDHRLLLRVTMQMSRDPWAPRGATSAGHVPIDYGLGDADGAMDERVQELIRQDESVRRGSSCVE